MRKPTFVGRVRSRRYLAAVGTASVVALGVAGAVAAAVPAHHRGQPSAPTATPIKHLVVIYLENRSFDNFFATYPHAANPPGEPSFHAAPDTPTINGLSDELLHHNPNLVQPYRRDRGQPKTCDPNHSYAGVQLAYDRGLVDHFVQAVGPKAPGCDPGQTMGYYDGNTVTGLWNYAQHFAMSDNNFNPAFGPSKPQIVNLVSGQTHGATSPTPSSAIVNGTLISNLRALHNDCGGDPVHGVQMSGRNIGDLLNAKNVTWGFFKQGFKPTSRVNGTAVCGATYVDRLGNTGLSDPAGEDPFQLYPSTANPHHLPPSSPAIIGRSDQANHQYDLTDFWQAAGRGEMPAVSFLRTSGPALSQPLDEQIFVAKTINRIERLPAWRSTAVVVTWDESGGYYDHVMPPIVNDSQSPADGLTGTGTCGDSPPAAGGFQDRCGYGARIPELVISPYSRVNYVDHTATAQPSIIHFAETNWNLSEIGGGSFDTRAGTIAGMFDFRHPRARPLLLDPDTGEPVHAHHGR